MLLGFIDRPTEIGATFILALEHRFEPDPSRKLSEEQANIRLQPARRYAGLSIP